MRSIAAIALVLAGCGFEHGAISPMRDAPLGDTTRVDGPPAEGIPPEGLPADVEIVIEAEDYTTTVTRGGHSWMSATDVVGFRGASAMRPLPDNGTPCVAAIDTTCSELQYSIAIPRDDQYRVFVRIRSSGTGDDSVWYGIDGTVRLNDIDPNFVFDQWLWRTEVGNPTIMLTAGTHVLSLWYRETGIRVDQVAVSTKSTPPS